MSKEELDNWKGLTNYVSHHAVLKPGSTTTPVRFVSNSSLDNNWSGVSYNDCLVKGPNALTPLREVLTTWRTYQHCIVWDISKAYNAIQSTEEHWHMRKLLWRWGKIDEPWDVYVIRFILVTGQLQCVWKLLEILLEKLVKRFMLIQLM